MRNRQIKYCLCCLVLLAAGCVHLLDLVGVELGCDGTLWLHTQPGVQLPGVLILLVDTGEQPGVWAF